MQGSSDKLNGQLKMHLDSIFDGFQKLISGSDESQEKRQLPFVIEKTIHNILFIKTHMQRQDEFDAVSCFSSFHSLFLFLSPESNKFHWWRKIIIFIPIIMYNNKVNIFLTFTFRFMLFVSYKVENSFEWNVKHWWNFLKPRTRCPNKMKYFIWS